MSMYTEALVYQKMGLFKGDQYYHVGVILSGKYAGRTEDVSL